MQHLEPHNLIAASPLFRSMPTQEAEAVLARLQPARYAQGAYILERGKWHGRLYLIAAGQVSVLLRDLPAEQADATALLPSDDASAAYVVARLGPGECFGEMSLITGEPPSATIRAAQDTSLWFLTQADFLALITTCPSLLQNINGILSQRLVRVNQYLAAQHAAELYLLAHMDMGERSLIPYIAEALAWRSTRRVLLLELCGADVASSLRFATQPGQLRPSLFACQRDSALLQAHRGSTLAADGSHMPALAALDETQEQVEKLDASLLLDLSTLSLLYDFIVLVVTQYTPAAVLSTLLAAHDSLPASGSLHVIQFISARDLHAVPTSSAFAQAAESETRTVFVSHAPEKPTVGVQDRYAQLLGHSVTRVLPADDALLARCWEQSTFPRQLAPDSPLSSAIDFVARFIAHQTVGIAFGGGAARGFAHLGVLERLLANRVPLDYMAACSSGIIAPGMFLIGKTLAEIEEICLQIQQHLVKWNLPRSAIFSNRGLKHMLHEICGEQRFEDLTIPFAMVAADLTTRAGVVLDRGLLWQAGLASVALPGIFPPVMLGEHILIDAGMHDPVPVRLLRQMGADILLASELGGQEPPALLSARDWQEQARQQVNPLQYHASPHIIDVILRTYDLAMATIGMYSVREADVVFRPKLYRVSLRQFSAGRKFISAGREAVEESLPLLRRYLPSL